MARILFLDVDQEVRCLLQETLEKHGYRVQYQEGLPGLKLFSKPDPSKYVLVSLDSEKSKKPVGIPVPQITKPRSSFTDTLLRALSTWNT